VVDLGQQHPPILAGIVGEPSAHPVLVTRPAVSDAADVTGTPGSLVLVTRPGVLDAADVTRTLVRGDASICPVT
jgi:hypothetical protein